MRNNSVPLFHLDNAPALKFQITPSGPRLTIGEPGSYDGVDFYIEDAHAERVKRAVAAFMAVMNEVAQEAAE